MEEPHNVEQRLTDLEIKATFNEDLLEELNQIVIRQQQQIDSLIREISSLRQQIPDGIAGQQARLIDDLPPHY